MKVQFDPNTRTDKNRQCITGGIFYCRDSEGFNASASNKLSCNLIGNRSKMPNVSYTKPLGPISTPFSNFESRFINKQKGFILNSNHSPVLNQGDALLHIGFDEKKC